MRLRYVLPALAFLSLLVPSLAYSKIGVGVGTGKIVVDEALAPGIIYKLPPLTVVNTGDEASGYTVGVEYHQDQEEIMPLEEWFTFTPLDFHLEPGDAQTVDIKLNLPIKTEPGDYFAYLEGRPVKKAQDGTTTIGVAAAAKLYFEVKPANLLSGLFHRGKSLWNEYLPWTNIIFGAVVILIIIKVASKYLDINVGFRKKKEERKKTKEEKDA